MSFPNPFQIGREVASNVDAAFTKVRDENAIESILSNAMKTGDPAVLQNSIGKILSQVSPERQGPAVQYLQNAFNNIQKRQEQKEQFQREKNAGLVPGINPTAQAAIYKENAKSQRLSQYGYGGDVASNGSPNPSGAPPNVPNPLPDGQYDRTPSFPGLTSSAPKPFNIRDLSDDQIVRGQGHPDIEVRNQYKAEQQRREAERKNDRADLRDKRKETQPLRQEIYNKASIAEQGIQEKERLLDLIKTGNINDPTVATILDAIPMNLGKRFLSEETVEYKAGLVNGFRDLRNIFSGATRVKEIELLEDKIADVYLTDEQKQAILRSSIQTLQYDLIRAEAAAEVEKDFPELGLLEFSKKVNELTKPRLNALANRVIDEQSAIIKDAENRKKIPLNSKDPESRQIIEQMIQEVGRDEKKLIELARKKGYIIGD